MSKTLDSKSRNILEFRPNIYFVEPDVKPGKIEPVTVGSPTAVADKKREYDEGKKLAKAVNDLATAMQAKVDAVVRTKGMVVKLHPKIGHDVLNNIEFP